MPLPNDDNLDALDVPINGAPCITGTLDAANESNSLDFVVNGAPLVGLDGGVILELVEQDETLDAIDEGVAGAVTKTEDLEASDTLEVLLDYTLDQEELLDAVDEDDVDDSDVPVNEEEELAAVDELETLSEYTLESEEGLGAADSGTTGVVVNIEETLDADDEEALIYDVVYEDTVCIQISICASYEDTNRIEVAQATLPDVVNYLSVGNPFHPTIVLDSDVLVTNPETDHGVTAAIRSIAIDNEGLFGEAACILLSFSISMNYAGGTFALETTSALTPGLEQTFQLFGMTATVLAKGEGVATNKGGKYYITRGKLSSPGYDKPVAPIALQNVMLAALVPSSRAAEPEAKHWTTLSAAAAAIGAGAGVGVAWGADDTPLTDFTQEAGGTVGSALASLASRVGAILLWDGGQGYIVTYPDIPRGEWEVPDCRLLLPDAFKTVDIQNYRPFTSPAFPFPNPPLLHVGDAVFYESPFYPIISKVEPIGKVTKFLEDEQARTYQVKPGYDLIKVQVVTATDASGPYVTARSADPRSEVWFDWGGSVYKRNDGTTWITVVPADIPSGNTDVQRGNFEMNLGFTRDLNPLRQAYDSDVKQRNAKNREQQSQIQGALRFIQHREGSINSVFFGSVPFPGMTGTATAEGVTATGIIQSVSINMPGTVSVEMANFNRFNIYQPITNINAQNAGDGG